MQINKIYSEDCVKVLKEKIKQKSVDLIYADPPYNLSGKKLSLEKNTTGGAFYKMDEKWDTIGVKEYLQFTDEWVSGCWEVLKEGGSIYISCSYHNIGEVIISAKAMGFKLTNILTWYKTNTMPNITKRTFTHSTEYICWFVKGKNWKFNYSEIKKIIPIKTKTGNLRQVRDLIELPLVQGKERLKGTTGRSLHPTQKPEKLLELIITASSDEGDLILDPFMGSGTTGVVAKRLKRNWIGIETDKGYIKAAYKRISA